MLFREFLAHWGSFQYGCSGEPGPDPDDAIGRPLGAVPTPSPEPLADDDPIGPVIGALVWRSLFGTVEDGLEDCPAALPFVAEPEVLELPDDPAAAPAPAPPAPPAPPPPWDQAALEMQMKTTLANVRDFIQAPVG